MAAVDVEHRKRRRVGAIHAQDDGVGIHRGALRSAVATNRHRRRAHPESSRLRGFAGGDRSFHHLVQQRADLLRNGTAEQHLEQASVRRRMRVDACDHHLRWRKTRARRDAIPERGRLLDGQ